MHKNFQKKTKVELLLDILIKENPYLREGLETYQKQEIYNDNLREFNRIRPSILVKDISREKEFIKNSFAIVDGIGSELFKKYLGVHPLNWFIFTNNSNNNDIKKFINKLGFEKKFLAIGTGFIQDIGKFIQIKSQKECICIPTALSTHVYGSMHISTHQIFNLKEDVKKLDRSQYFL